MNPSSCVLPGSTDNLWSRRSFLTTAATGALGMSYLGATESRRQDVAPFYSRPAKHVIFVFLVGGPSQIDTWDPKPHASSDVRNFDAACDTSMPGLQISENLPLMAQRMHQVSLVRSLHHEGPATHAAGQQQLMTGHCFYHNEAAPHWGSVVSLLLQQDGELPANIILGDPLVSEYSSVGSGQDSAWLSAEHQPCFVGGSSSSPFLGACRQSLDLRRESRQTRERYGSHDLGTKCLQARRLIESGARVVTVNQFSSVMDQTTWDMHANGGRLNSTAADYRSVLCPQLDQALSGLLDDLSDRGLLSETLVAVCGEMGRSPRINCYGGRDHHTGVWSGLLAGGPIRRGQVIGESDAMGEAPRSRPVTSAEFVATIYQALGISAADSKIPGPNGQPIAALNAVPIRELS